MDFKGPIPLSKFGNTNILVVMDHYSKWVEAFPTKDQTAETV